MSDNKKEWVIPTPLAYNYCATCGGELIIAHDGQEDRPHCEPCNRFFYHNPIPASCCFVTKDDGSLLFARRAVQPCFGEWTLPGGFVETGETTDEAALRELKEETNLDGTSVRLIGVSTKSSPRGSSVLVLGYHVEDWSGEEAMVPDTDASELRFFGIDERPQLPFQTHQELLALFDQQMGFR